jgi:uncharacterized protein YceH (UPF0502 family)
MRIMRRRIMATAISLAEVPKPSDDETEVLEAIEARQKLQATIELENGKREAAEIEFVRIAAKEISGSQVFNVDTVFQRDVAGKAAAERAKQRIEALESILAKMNKRIEQLKADSSYAWNAALTKRIEALEKALSEKEEAEKDLEDQINALKAEVIKMPKATSKKAS